jgi:polyisoprenyl-teichoic acid--peptidoglycan teichoic acid transferase
MKIKRILFTSIILFIAFMTSISIYTYSQINKIKNVKISKTDEDLGINSNIKLEKDLVEENITEDTNLAVKKETDTVKESSIEHIDYSTNEKYSDAIRSIALFGIDTRRTKYEALHSDSIIIATVDPQNNKIKLSSIMRDTYVKIKGHGNSKITNAYAYGGPQLALRTLNENFGLNIRDYATVDFFTLEKAIDVLGGVTVDVKPNELNELNYRITEAAQLQNKAPTLLRNPGIQNLNGIQAVAYCRIRKIGNGDFERTSRQRMVLSELINKTKSSGIIKYHSLASEIFPLIETSLSNSDILKLGRQVITTGISNVEQQRFPLDGYCKGEIIKGVWYLVPKPDMSVSRDQIIKFIFKDVKPVPKAPLF